MAMRLARWLQIAVLALPMAAIALDGDHEYTVMIDGEQVFLDDGVEAEVTVQASASRSASIEAASKGTRPRP